MEEIGGCLRPFVVSLASETRQRSLHGCCWPYQVEGVKNCDVTNAPKLDIPIQHYYTLLHIITH